MSDLGSPLTPTPEDPRDEPTATELSGPADGHQFHFALQVQGSHRFRDGPYTDEPAPLPSTEPFRATVRAWNLRDACTAAALLPLNEWVHEDDDASPLRQGEGEPEVVEQAIAVLVSHHMDPVKNDRAQDADSCVCGPLVDDWPRHWVEAIARAGLLATAAVRVEWKPKVGDKVSYPGEDETCSGEIVELGHPELCEGLVQDDEGGAPKWFLFEDLTPINFPETVAGAGLLATTPPTQPAAEDPRDKLLRCIWLYVKWFYVTKQLTTEQKNLWADIIDSTPEDSDYQRSPVHRWWLDTTDPEEGYLAARGHEYDHVDHWGLCWCGWGRDHVVHSGRAVALAKAAGVSLGAEVRRADVPPPAGLGVVQTEKEDQ